MDRRPEATPLGALDARACSWASTWTETRAMSARAELQRKVNGEERWREVAVTSTPLRVDELRLGSSVDSRE
jgi:hypothetical protein